MSSIPRRSSVSACIGAILSLRLNKKEYKPTERNSGSTTYKMVHSNVDPRNQILLCNILAIKKLVEVNYGCPGQVLVPFAARCRLRFLSP